MRLATTVLVFCVAALLALGMVMLYSASMTQKGAHYLLMQLVWCGLGLAACVAAACLDYHHLKRISVGLYLFAVLLLVLVLIPGVGVKINGARRWFDLKLMSFQPSELAKVVLIIVLAHYGERYQRQIGGFWRGIVLPGLLMGVVLALILLGRDYGTTMLVGSVAGVLLLLAGVRWRYALPLGVLALGVLALVIWHNPVRRDRVLAWRHPEQYAETVGYQAEQAKIALGAGGWTGLGLGNGRQKLGFVPEHHTDFILSVIGEELGLLATLGITLTYIILILCGMVISWKAADPFGMLLASGITFLVGLQAFINLGVVTSLLPNKGLPLPFISYGGSNLLFMLIGIGMLLSVACRALEPAPANPEILDAEVVSASSLI